MSFNNWKISRKLIAAFAVIVLGFCAVTTLVVMNLNTVDELQTKGDHSDDVLTSSRDVTDQLLDMSGQVRGFLLTREDAFATGVETDRAAMGKDFDALRPLVHSPDQQTRLQAMQDAANAYITEAAGPEVRLARDPATLSQGMAIFTGGLNKRDMDAFRAAVQAFNDRENVELNDYNSRERAAIDASRLTLMVGAGAALALSTLMGWLLSRMIAAPVSAMTTAMKRLAGGDNAVEVPAIGRKDEVGEMAGAVQNFKEAAIEKLRVEAEVAETRRQTEQERARVAADQAEASRTQALVVAGLASGLEKLSDGELTFRISEPFTAEYEKLRADFNAALEQLQQAMGVISSNATGMRTGAGEISQAADDLSKRTEQQAATLEETAAALDEITATVKKTAEGANRASSVVGGAKAEAERSGEVVREAVAAMGQIEQSAQKISQIIGVIDEIAFQTNLLALNAGVEAARAGDAGRGFAVVASEVRALAQRSAEAAKEIKTLISASSQQVAQGVTLVGQTGEALNGIVSKVGDITGLVSEITASTQEQASALAQVNTAVNQMDQVTQQNAAMVEQSTAASHSLSQEAEELARLVSRFKTGQEGGAVELPRRAPARAASGRPQSAAARPRHTATALKTTSQIAEPRDESWEEF